MLDINAWEFGVIIILGIALLGPDRLPEYASGLARLIRRGRDFARGAREQVRAEMGPEFDEIDWDKYDPRKYHPRAIVRNALAETFEDEDSPAPARGAGNGSANGNGASSGTGSSGTGRTLSTSRVNGATPASVRPAPGSHAPPPAVRDTAARSPEPATWEAAAQRLNPGIDTDAT